MQIKWTTSNLPFLKDWDVIDLVDLVNEISSGDEKHCVNDEFKLFCEGKHNNAGYIYFLDDDDLQIINSYLTDNFGYSEGETIMFWLSW